METIDLDNLNSQILFVLIYLNNPVDNILCIYVF